MQEVKGTQSQDRTTTGELGLLGKKTSGVKGLCRRDGGCSAHHELSLSILHYYGQKGDHVSHSSDGARR